MSNAIIKKLRARLHICKMENCTCNVSRYNFSYCNKHYRQKCREEGKPLKPMKKAPKSIDIKIAIYNYESTESKSATRFRKWRAANQA